MGFYDFKGYWRNDGEGFYDGKGYFRSPGEGFYDGKGYFRSPGEGFYDAKGGWVNPGASFVDGKGYRRSGNVSSSSANISDEESWLGLVVVLFPIVLIGVLISFFAKWCIDHFFGAFFIFFFINGIINFIIVKQRKHSGMDFWLSYVGNFFCIFSIVYVFLLYLIPYISIKGVLGSIFEFIVVMIFLVGLIAVIQSFNNYHQKAILEFVIGVLFMGFVLIVLKNNMTAIDTVEEFVNLYRLKGDTLFKVLFGFIVK